MKSPLYKKSKAIKIKELSTREIIIDYQQQFNIDVSRFFEGQSRIILYECEFSGYGFYYPLSLSGDDIFYQELEKFSWYYMPWKWEHEIVERLSGKNDRILEIGSGGLGFISKMNDLEYKVTGLELNSKSIKKAKEAGLNVFNKSVQDFAKTNSKKFDIVCSFQVLEHISEVKEFIESQLLCLKKGGKLIISVPNNESFIKYSEGGVLNKPPHHMGLWNQKSLCNLETIFNLTVENIYFEPLQEYHFDWFIDTVIVPYISKKKYLKKISKRISRKFQKRILKIFKPFIKGHSILVIYTKNN